MMWRHEAYKMSVQKRALELEATAELQRILERNRKQRQDISRTVSQAIDFESTKLLERLSVSFRRMSSRIDTLEDLVARSRSSLSRASASQSDLKRSHLSQLSQLTQAQRSFQDQADADRLKISTLEAANGQLRTALALEKRERGEERAELLAKISREQRYSHEAELARREAANESFLPVKAPPRAAGEVAALIEELHALEAEAQRLIPRR